MKNEAMSTKVRRAKQE